MKERNENMETIFEIIAVVFLSFATFFVIIFGVRFIISEFSDLIQERKDRKYEKEREAKIESCHNLKIILRGFFSDNLKFSEMDINRLALFLTSKGVMFKTK